MLSKSIINPKKTFFWDHDKSGVKKIIRKIKGPETKKKHIRFDG
jgi:hypothetical protein